MKPLTIGKWVLNVVLLLAGVVCLVLAMAGHQTVGGTTVEAVSNKFGVILTGLAFLALGGYFSWSTWKQSSSVAGSTTVSVPPPVSSTEEDSSATTQEQQSPTEKT